jgi:hypothetical protein
MGERPAVARPNMVPSVAGMQAQHQEQAERGSDGQLGGDAVGPSQLLGAGRHNRPCVWHMTRTAQLLRQPDDRDDVRYRATNANAACSR